MKKVCIFVEHQDGVITSNSQKIIHMAQSLKKRFGYQITALIIDKDDEQFLAYLQTIDLDIIYKINIIDHNKIIFSKDEIDNLVYFLKKIEPDIAWATNSSRYRILFPQLAYILNTGLCAACTNYKFDEVSKCVNMVRMVYSNNIYAQIAVHRSKPLMATILDEEKKYDLKRNLNSVEIHHITDQIIISEDNNINIEMMKKIQAIGLNHSKVVIGLGNGINSKADLALFEKLAMLLDNAAIGGTREVVNRQIIPPNYQIGSTGMQIYADLYIAFGISGAPQHIQGIEHVKQIIAVNNDPYAAMFEYSDYGVIGDLFEVANYMIKYLGGKETP